MDIMTMTLLTPHGRYDRAAIVERAKQLQRSGWQWGTAMREAYAEAQAEREPAEVTNIRCRALAATADRLMAKELERW